MPFSFTVERTARWRSFLSPLDTLQPCQCLRKIVSLWEFRLFRQQSKIFDRIHLIFVSFLQVYHQVNLILPFREIKSIEKATESVNMLEIETQSAVIITGKNTSKPSRCLLCPHR